jgi:DNA-binding transcriptional regulator of glucitol operon
VRGNRVTARRLTIVAACVVSVLGACLLAWWQWNRFESASGSFQNLGYVLQWPLFGLFPAFMVWRVRRLREREARVRAEPVRATPPPPTRRPEPVPVAEPDDELTAYNRYLAELNAKDQA